MKFAVRVLSTLCCVIPFFASAEKSEAFNYLGVGLATQNYEGLNFSPSVDTSALGPLTYSDNDRSTGFRLLAGHQWNRYIAFEGGLSSLGKGDFKVTEATTDANGKAINKAVHQGDFRTYAFDARVVATYPFDNKWYLKGTLGAMFWQNELSRLGGTPAALEVTKVKETGVSMLSSIGIGYGFNKNVAVTLDYEKNEVADHSMDSVGISVLFRF